MRWRDFTRMPGMNEKGTHRGLARDYFSDSWLVRFWQYLAYFSNKDYRNHETVLTATTRTKLGTKRLWISFFSFLVKCWKWKFIFNWEPGGPGEDQEGSRKGSPQVHLFRSYARSNRFWFFKFSEASEQQRIKHSQRLKLFTTIQFIP